MIAVIKRFIMGMVIGASMLIPGVSGGCMAIILGIYDELISLVSNIRKAFIKNSLVLINYLAGGLLGVILISEPLLRLVTWQRIPCMYFFIGAIIACIPPLYRRAIYGQRYNSPGFSVDGLDIKGSTMVHRREKIKVVNILAGIVGAGIGISLQYVPTNLITTSNTFSIVTVIALLVSGFILAVALVLPGISGSYILLIFGLYDITLIALKEIDLPFLIPLAVGALIGTFGTASLIDKLMKRHPQFIYLLIIGFMIGSLYQVFPGLPKGINIPISIVTFAVGFIVIFVLGLFGDRDKKVLKDDNLGMGTPDVSPEVFREDD